MNSIFHSWIGLVLLLPVMLSAGCDIADEALKNPAVSSSTSSVMLIKNFHPTIGDAGTEVTVNGLGFESGISGLVEGGAGFAVKVVSDGELRFTIPEQSAGLVYLRISQGDATGRLPFIVTNSKVAQLYLGDQASLCSNQNYMRLDGSVVSGTKECNKEQTMKKPGTCTGEGQVGCVANSIFPAIEMAGLSKKIAPGHQIAGISIPLATQCTKDN